MTELCTTCESPLTDDNWPNCWRKRGSKQCKGCSHKYNDKSNKRRMYLNGKYIPQDHPLWKPGRYKSLDDAWSHQKIESTDEGDVYVIVNSAWPEWVKVGKASIAQDRLNGYQTSSPFRDYSILITRSCDNRHKREVEMHKLFEKHASERKGEWFHIDKDKAVELFSEAA